MKPICWLSLLVLLVSNDLSRGDEPLPPPRRVEPAPAPAPVVIYPYYRVSAYAVWDHYAVDRQGFFRLRVIDTPTGAFYSYNGKPYPWTTTHSRDYMPRATD
jgi:hypothetical protein